MTATGEGNIKYSDGSIGVAPILNNEQTTDSLVKKRLTGRHNKSI